MKCQKFPKPTEKHAKTLLFSGFFAVFVSRETDAENQTVPRETYIFHCLKYPSQYRFCARFYSLIIAVLHLKSYVKNRLFHIVFTSHYPYSNTNISHKIKAISATPRSDFTAARSTRQPSPTISHASFAAIYRPRRTPPVIRYEYRFDFIHIFKSAENYKSALLLLFRGIVVVFFKLLHVKQL